MTDDFIRHAFFAGPKSKLRKVAEILGIDRKVVDRQPGHSGRLQVFAEHGVTREVFARAEQAWDEEE